MWPYWLIFILPLASVTARNRTGNQRLAWFLLLVLLSLFIGLRYHVGGDWGNYLRHFEAIHYLKFSDVLSLEGAKKAVEDDDLAAMEAAMEQLTQASHKMAEAMYQNTGAQADGDAGQADQGANGSGGDDDVIDAEYVDVDDKDKDKDEDKDEDKED